MMKGMLCRYAAFLLTACSVAYTRNIATASSKPSDSKYDSIVFPDLNEPSARVSESRTASTNMAHTKDNPVVFTESKKYSKLVYTTLNLTTEGVSTNIQSHKNISSVIVSTKPFSSENDLIFFTDSDENLILFNLTIKPTTKAITPLNQMPKNSSSHISVKQLSPDQNIIVTDLKTSSKPVLPTIKPKIDVIMIKGDLIMDTPVGKAHTKTSYTNNDNVTFPYSEPNSNLIHVTITSTTEANFDYDKFLMDIPEQDCPNRGCRVYGECRECD